jgi:hypothetical protein
MLALWFLACAHGTEPTPISEPLDPETTVNPVQTGLLVEMVYSPARGRASGFRIFGDGRYETLDGTRYTVDASGRLILSAGDGAFKPLYTFTADELAKVRKAITDADPAALAPEYLPRGKVMDAGRLEWRFGLDSGPKDVVIQGYPANKVAALDGLFKVIASAHAWPQETSTWTVDLDGVHIEREIACGVLAVPELGPVLRAMYEGGGVAGEGASVTAGGTVMLAIAWRVAGAPSSTTRLYADGRVTDDKGGTEKLRRTLDAKGLAAAKQALVAADLGRDRDWCGG